jgi:hypothetical protein
LISNVISERGLPDRGARPQAKFEAEFKAEFEADVTKKTLFAFFSLFYFSLSFFFSLLEAFFYFFVYLSISVFSLFAFFFLKESSDRTAEAYGVGYPRG